MSNANIAPVSESQLTAFVALLQGVTDADHNTKYGDGKHPHMAAFRTVLGVDMGKKYAKIVRRDAGRIGEKIEGKSVFGFVDMTTGLVYKAASYKKVETNFPRGNWHASCREREPQGLDLQYRLTRDVGTVHAR